MITEITEKTLTGLNLGWGVPFVGVLLSIALGPLIAPKIWHHHIGKVCFFWSAIIIAAMIYYLGVWGGLKTTGGIFVHHYVPFVLMVGGLYVMASGVNITISCRPSPAANTVFLGIAALFSSIMGTTGASMVFIRPFLVLNKNRQARAHQVIFFIFLVCNIGGSLTAVGDPPLFLGFLEGIPFFWSFFGIGPLFLVVFSYLLISFFGLDYMHWRRESATLKSKNGPVKIKVTGWIHGGLMIVAIIGMIICGHMDLGNLGWVQDAARDLILLMCSGISFWVQRRPKNAKDTNGFWEPIQEIAFVFAAIFITAHPVLEILKEGPNGALAALAHIVTDGRGQPVPSLYFWVSGLLSSVLDNAPTYLVFFELAGGDAATFLSSKSLILSAFSAGAVFMGAMTYIGNAPNFMVKSISQSAGIPMPHFFHYIGWSAVWLLPIFGIVSLLFF